MTAEVSLLLPGYALATSCGPLGFASVPLITANGLTILVDTGVHQTRARLLAELAARDLGPNDIDVVVVTHLHFDHSQNMHLFKKARVILHANEIEYCLSPPPADTFIPDWWQQSLDVCNVELMTGDSLSITPDVDVLLMPGHHPGQLAVRAQTAAGATVCASDVAKDVKEILTRRPRIFADADAGTAKRSIDRLLHIADVIIPGHDRVLTVQDGNISWEEEHRIRLDFY